MLHKIAPILPAHSITQTHLFYKNTMAFITHNYGNYLVVKKDEIEIHYYQWQGPGKLVPVSCYLFDTNIEDLFAKFSSMDLIKPAGNIKDNSWGRKEFFIYDNNENVLRFGGM